MNARCRFIHRGSHLGAILTIPYRDAVPPPQLSADTPVPDVLRPVKICLGEAFRNYGDPAVLNSLDGGFSQRLCSDEPLQADLGFNHRLATTTMSYRVRVGLDFLQKSFVFQVSQHLISTGEPFQSLVGTSVFIHSGIGVHDIYQGQIMSLSYLEVREVMGGRYLQGSGAERSINSSIGNYGNSSIYDRKSDILAYEILVALVLGIYRHSRVAQESLRSGGGHGDEALALSYGR